MSATHRPNRMTRLAAPAAVIGTLAAAIAVAPAEAEEPRPRPAETGPLRLLSTPDTPMQATAAAVVRQAARAKTYTVQRGDTVYAIAQRFGLKTAHVLAWNKLTWKSVIRPGQTLRLTAPSADNRDTRDDRTNNDHSGVKYHTVARGDTVYGIAKKYRTTVSKIVAWNRLGGSAVIYPGQKLRVSAGTTTNRDDRDRHDPREKKNAKTHTVVAGDTLYGIARKYDLTVRFLLRANSLGEGSIIYPGQTLRLTMPENTQHSATLDATQKANAAKIVRIGRQLGVPERGIAIALATAMVESSMRNLRHGDRDSLGLFQQRPSQGWGTRSQITDADRSIRVFYGGRHDPNGSQSRGLLDIRGWQAMAFTDAAQAVQISAYPDRYGQWEQQAHRWVAALR